MKQMRNIFSFIALVVSLPNESLNSIFVSNPECYRQAFSEEVIYSVNETYIHLEDIKYIQVTCYSQLENTFCNKFEIHKSICCRITSVPGKLKKSVSLRCPLRTTNFTNTRVVKARAFKNNLLIDESYLKIMSSLSVCYCNWNDIKPKMSFVSSRAKFTQREKIILKLDFKTTYRFHLRTETYLVTKFSQIPICKTEIPKYISGNITTICNLEHYLDCDNYSVLLRMNSFSCRNQSYELTRVIPTQFKEPFVIFESNFTCERDSNNLIVAPVLLDKVFKYTVKVSDMIVQEGIFNQTGLRLRGYYDLDIQIRVCKTNCICSNYIILNICNNKHEFYKLSSVTITAISLSVAILIVVTATAVLFCISRKRYLRSFRSSRDVQWSLFDTEDE